MNNVEEKKNIPESSDKPIFPKKNKKKLNMKRVFSVSNICFTLTVVLIIISGLVVTSTIRKGSESAQEAYENSKNKAIDEAYNMFYDTAFASAERKYHVANTISIEVASVREEANLEVLKVSDVEYVIGSEDNIEVWMEFYGEGVYTVDMKASEFIIDSARQYVLVRVPRPELTKYQITKANQLRWENDRLINWSNSVGADLAAKMRAAGNAKLNNYMKSNAKFYKSAKESATMVISDLIKGLNSELPNLVVEVEFID